MHSVLTDKQWEKIEDILPGKASDCGVTAKDNRLFVDAVLWMARNGARWRALPEAYGDWHSVYVRFARWAKLGIWHRVIGMLAANANFDYAVVDSTVVCAHQRAAGQKGGPGFRPLAIPMATRHKHPRGVRCQWLTVTANHWQP